ncbi:MAG: hypothetical protein M3443_07385, partial [Actinomycetota bacterium]|nr:hypothetical protein [Actinomycetota bacterium]
PVVGKLATIVGSVLGPVLSATGAVLGVVADGAAALPTPVLAAVAAFVAWKLIGDRITSGAGALTGALVRPWQEMRVQTALAAAEGQGNINKITAAISTMESRYPAVARMGDAYRTWSARVAETVSAHTALVGGMGGVDGRMTATATAVDKAGLALGRFSGVAGGAAAAGLSGLKSAAGGLMGALGGPWGVAITAAATVLGILVSKQQAAAAATAAHKQRVAELADTLDRQTGAVTRATRELKAKELAEKGMFASASTLGISQAQLVDAFTGQGAALDVVNGKIRDNVRESVQASQQYGAFASEFGDTAANLDLFTEAALGNDEALRKVWGSDDITDSVRSFTREALGSSDAMNGLAIALGISNDDLISAQGNAKDMAGAMGGASTEASALSVAAKALGGDIDGATGRVQALTAALDALDALAGDTMTVEEATQRVHDITRGLGEAFKAAADGATAAKVGILDATGAINTATEGGSALQNTVQELASAYREQYAATLQATGSHEQAAIAADGARQSLIEVGTAALGSADAAVILANRYGLVPEFVRTQIEQPGMDASQIALMLLRDQVIAVPDSKSITVSSNASPMMGLVQQLGYKVKELPDGTFTITANTGAAEAALNAFVSKQRTIIVGVVTTGKNLALPRESVAQAEGGIMEYYADGGIRPMSAMTAAIVTSHRRNGTQRVVGDNAKVSEAFIPLDPHNAQYQSILDKVLSIMRPEDEAPGSVLFDPRMNAILDKPMPGLGRAWGHAPKSTSRAWGSGERDSSGALGPVDRSRNNTFNVSGPDARTVARMVIEEMRAEEMLYGP